MHTEPHTVFLIASTIEQQGMHGIQLLPGLMEVFLLLFANDIVLIPDTPVGLQTQLDVLNDIVLIPDTPVGLQTQIDVLNDIVLIPDTPKGLQTQLDVLSSACKGLFLGTNIDKQK